MVVLLAEVVPVLVALIVSLLALLVPPPIFTSFKILSFNLYIVFPALASCLNTFWVFFNFLWCFVHVYFKVQGKKVKTIMDPIFEHPVFDSARERVKWKTTGKTTGISWKIVVHLFQMWEQQCIFHRKTGQVYLWRNICIQQVSWLSQ